MSATAKLCIEHIVIGLQVVLILIFMLGCRDQMVFETIKDISGFTQILLVVPLAYSIGIVMTVLFHYTYHKLLSQYYEKERRYTYAMFRDEVKDIPRKNIIT